MKTATLFVSLALVAAPLTASAGGPSPGRYRMTANTEYPGDLWLAPVGDTTCAFYRYDGGAAKSGAMTLRADASKLDGTWEEGSSTGKVSFKVDGKKLDGAYTDGDDPATSPWVASYVGAKAKLEKSYDLKWDEGDKTTVTFKVTGSKVEGKVAYLYSGTSGGTMTGTLYGDVVAGTWREKGEDGKVSEGRFVLTFEKSLGSKIYDHVEGVYSADLSSCGNGGLFTGTTTR